MIVINFPIRAAVHYLAETVVRITDGIVQKVVFYNDTQVC